VVADRSTLTPGRVVCVATDSGGYRIERGFDLESTAAVPFVPPPPLPPEIEAQSQAEESEGGEDLSAAEWKTIACHVAEVAEGAGDIATATNLPARIRDLLVLAGRWHDLGKTHPAFQGAIRFADRPDREDLAKAPRYAWLRPPGTYRAKANEDDRPGFRHELASVLGLFAVMIRYEPEHPALLGPWTDALRLTGHAIPIAPIGLTPTAHERAILACSAAEFDLIAYLVASHHGKVRAALHAAPKDQDYRDPGDGRGLPIRGVREGDVLPSIAIETSGPRLPSLTLTLEPASIGLSMRTGRSWRERTNDLVDRFGPGALAWLEAIMIAADRRASNLKTGDPALSRQESRR